ncbi:hypothetical protein B0T12DRAFT_136344 [Alternaria alternata]|nr:hypothetical protein B0T12DRAFT_136344 [Alternaria alternata]
MSILDHLNLEFIDIDVNGVPIDSTYEDSRKAHFGKSATASDEWGFGPSSPTTPSIPSQNDPSILQQRATALSPPPPSTPLSPPRIVGPAIEPRRPAKVRLGLPITLHNHDVPATVLACADTGADVNIMSDEVARILGYSKYDALVEKKQLTLANGKIVEAIGRIESACSFGTEIGSSATMTCIFYVLLKVATPLIMGVEFLEQTETMTKHRERLIRVQRPALQALSISSLGKPKRLLRCELNFEETLATPDTGSDLDLMTPSFASSRGLEVYPAEEMVELADGSILTTTGFVRANLSIDPLNLLGFGENAEMRMLGNSAIIDFFLLEDLAHDLIVGDESLEELNVFQDLQWALTPVSYDSHLSELNAIRHLGTVDRVISKIEKLFSGASSNGRKDEESNSSLEALMIRQQRENDRREREAARIERLPQDEQQTASAAETAKRNSYQHQPSEPPSVIGKFVCSHPECTKPPFQTQYLLDSHSKTHSKDGLYFCPVLNCSRGEGGRGFKSKDKMMRHGVVHQSKGCACASCTGHDIF